MTNNDQAKPELYLDLDKRRRLVLDFNAIHLWETHFNKSFIYDVKWDRPRITDIVSILWASMATDDPDLKFSDMNTLVTMENANKFRPVIEELMRRAMQAQTDGAEVEVSEEKKTNGKT